MILCKIHQDELFHFIPNLSKDYFDYVGIFYLGIFFSNETIDLERYVTSTLKEKISRHPGIEALTQTDARFFYVIDCMKMFPLRCTLYVAHIKKEELKFGLTLTASDKKQQSNNIAPKPVDMAAKQPM